MFSPASGRREVSIVDALPSNGCKPRPVLGQAQRPEPQRPSSHAWPLGSNRPPVVLSDIEPRVALVNCTKECLQLGEQRVICPRQAAVAVSSIRAVKILESQKKKKNTRRQLLLGLSIERSPRASANKQKSSR